MKPDELIGSLRRTEPDQKIKGIYMIYCIDAKKCYVGQSKSITRRWRKHCSELRSGRHYNEYLQRSWDKYGPRSFECYVLEQCENTNDREAYWANKIDKEYIYNLGGMYSVFPMSPEQRVKIGLRHKGKKLSEDHRKKLSESHKGQKAWNKGIPHSEEMKKKLSEGQRRRTDLTPQRKKEIYEKRSKRFNS